MTPPESSATAVPLPAAGGAVRVRPDMRLLGLLALGHMVIDINQGSLAAVLPFLKDALKISYTATGVIVLMANITTSVIQPLFGYLADKTERLGKLVEALGGGDAALEAAGLENADHASDLVRGVTELE